MVSTRVPKRCKDMMMLMRMLKKSQLRNKVEKEDLNHRRKMLRLKKMSSIIIFIKKSFLSMQLFLRVLLPRKTNP